MGALVPSHPIWSCGRAACCYARGAPATPTRSIRRVRTRPVPPAVLREQRARGSVTQHPAAGGPAGTAVPLGVFDPANGDLLGTAGLVKLDRGTGEAEIGLLDRAHARGRGVATTAARAVARYGAGRVGPAATGVAGDRRQPRLPPRGGQDRRSVRGHPAQRPARRPAVARRLVGHGAARRDPRAGGSTRPDLVRAAARCRAFGRAAADAADHDAGPARPYGCGPCAPATSTPA